MRKNMFSLYMILVVIGLTSIFLFPALGKTECERPDPSGECVPADWVPSLDRPSVAIVEVVPGAAELVSPSGTIATTTPTYIWKAVSYSTWYYLWVNDSTGNRIKQWYTAAEVGCPAGTGNCSVGPSTPHAYAGTGYLSLAPGVGHWWVQTFDSDGYGPWSAQKDFNFDQYGKYCQNIGSVSFTSYDSSVTYAIYNGWRYRTGGSQFFDASVNLPAGAQITQIYVDYYDADASGDVWVFVFDRRPGTDDSVEYGEAKSSGTPGYGRLTADVTPYNVIVDNVGHSYHIRVRLDAANQNNRFLDAIICYAPSP